MGDDLNDEGRTELVNRGLLHDLVGDCGCVVALVAHEGRDDEVEVVVVSF